MNLFHIGRKFYHESGSAMSSISTVDTFERSDWDKVQIALENGETVTIRPATASEMQWAEIKLAEKKEFWNNLK